MQVIDLIEFIVVATIVANFIMCFMSTPEPDDY
jgi:hypothetical protein